MQADTEALLDFAHAHGVDALLARSALAVQALPADADRLKALLAGYEALSLLRTKELRRVLDALATAGLRPIIIKGAHLAHVLYESPALRPRSDTDLVIAQEEEERASRALQELGYERLVHVRGTLILGQSHFIRRDDADVEHALDVHWRIASPLVFRDVMSADTLRASAVPIPELGSAAWGPALPHALLIACVHVVAHHREDPLLLWFYEIAALVRALDEAGVNAFVECAVAGRITAVCAAALQRAQMHFGSPRLYELAQRLHEHAGAHEPSAQLLRASRRVDELWLDLRVSNGWGERLTLLREHLWPDAEYMRAITNRAEWLPFAYARRAAAGALKWSAPTDGSGRREEPAGWRADSAEASASRAPSKTSL